MATDDDPVRATAEIVDVVLNPFHSEALIQQADVLGCTWGARESENVDAEVHRYHDDVLRVGQVLPVVERSIGAADGPSCERERRVRVWLLGWIEAKGQSQKVDNVLPPWNSTMTGFDFFGVFLAQMFRVRQSSLRFLSMEPPKAAEILPNWSVASG